MLGYDTCHSVHIGSKANIGQSNQYLNDVMIKSIS